jgi:hypothetical protein
MFQTFCASTISFGTETELKWLLHIRTHKYEHIHLKWPPLWSSGLSFWLQIQRSWVRFPALLDILSNTGPRTASSQPREDK